MLELFHLLTVLYHWIYLSELYIIGTSMVVQRLRLCTSTAGNPGSIPGQGTRFPHASTKDPVCVLQLRAATDKSINILKINKILKKTPKLYIIKSEFYCIELYLNFTNQCKILKNKNKIKYHIRLVRDLGKGSILQPIYKWGNWGPRSHSRWVKQFRPDVVALTPMA